MTGKDFSKVALVLADRRAAETCSLLFADTFLKTAMAQNRIPLVRNSYIHENALSRSDLPKNTDVYLEIALTHCYPGNQTDHFPTSVGAVAKLIDAETHQTLWHMNYAYASPAEKAAETADSQEPLKTRFTGIDGKRPVAVQAAPEGIQTQPTGPFMVYVASVKNRDLAEQYIDTRPSDGTVRVSTVVRSNPEKPWYQSANGLCPAFLFRADTIFPAAP